MATNEDWIHEAKLRKQIQAGVSQLDQQSKMGVERNELLPNMRSYSVDTHIIFYRLQKHQVEIVRALHSRQDSLKHFK